MKLLVTGSAGHLGEALMRSLRASGHEAFGIDLRPSPFTHAVGSIADRGFVAACMRGIEGVLHTATLHKPHVATHAKQAFVDANITGTLNLLEAAVAVDARAFVFASTTSSYGRALTPEPGAPAVWVTEETTPLPKNIYGVTKLAAESLCELVHREHGLPCVVLRLSRFFPEDDDSRRTRADFVDANAKVNEYLFRRVDIEDVVEAHLRALERAGALGFGRYIVSATTPLRRDDVAALRRDAPAIVADRVPAYAAEYRRRGWTMFPSIDRVYVNDVARAALGWQPRHDFTAIIERLGVGGDHRSALAQAIGAKGYHAARFDDGPYPVAP
ncbi:MAG TPA: NAD(P)-dependent oxidoreductase [Burkholderiaceae bacterium]|nr:NAD(P)-dependent oxidoreductase [Burkholderiaceae bacterium]